MPPRPDTPYHITARTNNRELFPIDLAEVWEIFENQLWFLHNAFGVRIHAFVLMNNHFHLLMSDPQLQLSPALRWLMTETSREIGNRAKRINHLYGQRNYQCQIPNYHYYRHAYKYVYRNPVAAGIVDRVEDYPFSTLHSLIKLTKVNIPLCDSLISEDKSGVLDWLNFNPKPKDWQLIRKALRKGEFTLSREPNTNQPSSLESLLL
jgi:putative transposase